jgi:anti-sigma-K factor RskA
MKLHGRALEQMAGAYALGTLSDRARRRFELLLLRDVGIRRALQLWEQRLSALTPDIPSVRPPDQGWAHIENRLQQRQPRRAKSPLRWLLAAALLVGIALAAVWWRVRR